MTHDLKMLLQEFREKIDLHLDETEDFDADYQPSNRLVYIIDWLLEEATA